VKGTVEVKKVQRIGIRPSPLAGQIVLIRGKRGDAASIIIRSAQRVLRHSIEKTADFCAHCQLQGVACQVSFRFDLSESSDLRIGALHVEGRNGERRKGSVEVARPIQIEAADAGIGSREYGRFLQLRFHTKAVVQVVRQTKIRRKADNAVWKGLSHTIDREWVWITRTRPIRSLGKHDLA